jgi:ribosome maturation factor RimP
MAAPSREGIVGLLTPVVEAHDLDLEDLSLSPAGKRRVLRVIVDADGGVDLDLVAAVSHDISDALEQTDIMGSMPYVLEVTSPGVDRPLLLPRHWRRAATRLVTVTLTDGTAVTGRVLAAEDDPGGAVTLDVDGADRAVPYADVARAKVEVEFSRPKGAKGDKATSDMSTDTALTDDTDEEV